MEKMLNSINVQLLLLNEVSLHNNIISEDEDASDSIKFDLLSNEGASVGVIVPSGYVLLLKSFVMSDYDDNAYTLWFDDNPYVVGPEIEAPSGFLAIDENTDIQFVVLNSSVHPNEYLCTIQAAYRRKSEWKWPTIRQKSQIGAGGF